MSEYFESLRKGAKEALAWKQGKDTGARVRQYTALDVTDIRKKTKMTQRNSHNLFKFRYRRSGNGSRASAFPRGRHRRS